MISAGSNRICITAWEASGCDHGSLHLWLVDPKPQWLWTGNLDQAKLLHRTKPSPGSGFSSVWFPCLPAVSRGGSFRRHSYARLAYLIYGKAMQGVNSAFYRPRSRQFHAVLLDDDYPLGLEAYCHHEHGNHISTYAHLCIIYASNTDLRAHGPAVWKCATPEARLQASMEERQRSWGRILDFDVSSEASIASMT